MKIPKTTHGYVIRTLIGPAITQVETLPPFTVFDAWEDTLGHWVDWVTLDEAVSAGLAVAPSPFVDYNATAPSIVINEWWISPFVDVDDSTFILIEDSLGWFSLLTVDKELLWKTRR